MQHVLEQRTDQQQEQSDWQCADMIESFQVSLSAGFTLENNVRLQTF